MEKKYIDVPGGLKEVIFSRIDAMEIQKAKIRFALFGFLSLSSLSAVIGSIMYLWQNILLSGFDQYLSLALSDSTSLLTYWREFSLTLAESLPLMAVTLVLCALGLFVWSSAKAYRDAETLFLTA